MTDTILAGLKAHGTSVLGADKVILTDESGEQYTKGGYVVLTGNIAALNDALGATQDAVDLQSVSVQIKSASTFVGSIAFEVSNDGVVWVSKTLTAMTGSQSNVPSLTAGAAAMYSGDIGARYFRLRVSAVTTAGTVAATLNYSALSTAPVPLASVSVSGSVSATVSNVNASALLTSTVLAANATYTGTTVDSGTSFATIGATTVRAMVMHTAGLVPGHLILQESVDNVTWRETKRQPVPSDGMYHTFDYPVHMRYYRFAFINGTVLQTAFYLAYVSARAEGVSADLNGVLTFPETPAVGIAVAASATLTGSTLDLGANHSVNVVRATVMCDAAVGAALRIEWSFDNVNWFLDQNASASVPAIGTLFTIEAKAVARYVRSRLLNIATAQTSVRLYTTLVTL